MAGDRPINSGNGAITAGGTSQLALTANQIRRTLFAQNPSTAAGQGIGSAESLFVNFTAAAGIRGVQSMLAIAQDRDHEKAPRDVAIIRLAYGLGLRRGEIESLNIVHLDGAAGTLHVLGKGRTEREPMTLTGAGSLSLREKRSYSLRNGLGLAVFATREEAIAQGNGCTGLQAACLGRDGVLAVRLSPASSIQTGA